jgi:hypothetical protein
VEITAALAADLTKLTQALDDGTDIVETLQQLAASAQEAVQSYLGLTVTVVLGGGPIDFSVFGDSTGASVIGASLMLALTPSTAGNAAAQPLINLVLYARAPGAFTDLAADLCWLTGCDTSEFVMDRHLKRPIDWESARRLAAIRAIDEALGVLIGQGHTPDQATDELDRRARAGAVERHVAAGQVLAQLAASRPEYRGEPMQPVET